MKNLNTKNFSRNIFLLFLLFTVTAWFMSRDMVSSWANVPPPPNAKTAAFFSLGDTQLAYRQNILMLQNLGYGPAEDVPLKNYNYANLKKWFDIEDMLDPVSDAMPMLAAYYFGAVSDPEKLRYVVDYLGEVGQRPIKEKWRWLGRAVYLAKYEMKAPDKALELSYLLADNKNPNLADWARQMPAFILTEQGQEKTAYQIMLNILASRYDKLHPNEVNFMQDYMCNKLLPKIPDEPRPLFCN